MRHGHPGSAVGEGPAGYYADSAEAPGVWRTTGGAGSSVHGLVDAEQLRRVLLGEDPMTGAGLVDAAGSALRARRDRTPGSAPSAGDPDQWLSAGEAAALIGVSSRYVRRLAVRHERASPDTVVPCDVADSRPAEQDTGPTGDVAVNLATNVAVAAGAGVPDARSLPGVREGRGWRFRRADVEAFAAQRSTPGVVMAYDVTFSAPKSVSLLWAVADPATRARIDAIWDHSVQTGLEYLRRHAVQVRRGPRVVAADGIYAASYRHLTNRANEPQLHEHVVIANIAGADDGRVLTLDGRALFRHYRTAGVVAGAELRRRLTEELGWGWGPVRNGVADVAVVDRDVIEAFSSRRREVLAAVAVHGNDSAAARQHAAVVTRAAKATTLSFADIEQGWRSRLGEYGITAETAAPAPGPRPAPDPNGPATDEVVDRDGLFSHLAGPAGATRDVASFTRRDVIAAIAATHPSRFDAAMLEDLADGFCASRHAVQLVIDGAGPEPIYSTHDMLAAQTRLVAAYTQPASPLSRPGVPAAVIDIAIAAQRLELGPDQAALVHGLCGSARVAVAAVGVAGAGKTVALAAAFEAWRAAGRVPIGAAVTAVAAEVLEAATASESLTVAALLARLDHAPHLLHADHVVVVDEASTLSDRDHDRLLAHVGRAGAQLRTIGDPAQHGAVEAGGTWARLTRDPDVVRLTRSRRQAAPELADVRAAGTDLRAGRHRDALDRLDDAGRIHTPNSASATELLDRLVDDWWTDRTATDHAGPVPVMMAEHHAQRRALNARAQQRLLAAGVLAGAPLVIPDGALYVGDRVRVRAQDRALRPGDGSRGFVRNGHRGVVVAIDHDTGTVRVELDGRGPLEVPASFLHDEVRPGVRGALVADYAVTTHAAQGDTYRAGRLLATERTSAEGLYVALTRGTHDAALYLATDRALHGHPLAEDDPRLPVLDDHRDDLDQLAGHLDARRAPVVPALDDPDAVLLAGIDSGQPASDTFTQRHDAHAAAETRRHLLDDPAPAVVERIGSRPAPGPHRDAWDHAAVILADAPDSPAAVDAVRECTIETLAGRDLDDLLRERDRTRDPVAVADAAVADARRHLEHHRQRLDPSRPDPTIRRELHRWQHNLNARLTHAATLRLTTPAPADRPDPDRAGIVDAAIERRVRRTIDAADPDLQTRLGPRPAAIADRAAWDAAAHRLLHTPPAPTGPALEL